MGLSRQQGSGRERHRSIDNDTPKLIHSTSVGYTVRIYPRPLASEKLDLIRHLPGSKEDGKTQVERGEEGGGDKRLPQSSPCQQVCREEVQTVQLPPQLSSACGQ